MEGGRGTQEKLIAAKTHKAGLADITMAMFVIVQAMYPFSNV